MAPVVKCLLQFRYCCNNTKEMVTAGAVVSWLLEACNSRKALQSS